MSNNGGDASGQPWSNLRSSLPSRGALGLFSANVVAALIGLAVNVFLAARLGGSEFGRYAFVVGLATFFSLFFDLGYFSSSARLLAATHDDQERRDYLGGTCIVGVVLAGAMGLTVYGSSYVVDSVFPDRISELLRPIAWATPAVLAPFFLEQVAKGCGRAQLIGHWHLASKISVAVLLLVLDRRGELTALNALAALLIPPLLLLLWALWQLRPRFATLRSVLRGIVVEHRSFGQALYLGRSFNLICLRTDNLLLQYFGGAVAVGHYQLATTLAAGIPMFSQNLVALQFREFAEGGEIRRHLLRTNLGMIVALGVLISGGGSILLYGFLRSSLAAVVYLLPLAVVAAALQGLYQPFNGWLLANAKGQALQSLLFRVGLVNLGANVVLTWGWGAAGTLAASILGAGTYLWQSQYYYRIALKGK